MKKEQEKKTIYIFDLLGSYCGMHYYDIAFAQVLRSKDYNTYIYSNFTEQKENQGFFPLIFKKNKIIALLMLIICYIKYLVFILSHKKNRIIYLTYGEIYELPFLCSTIFSSNIYIDVHEVHALKYKDNSIIANLFNTIYRYCVRRVIYHSNRTKEILKNKKIKMYYVPHFKYSFKQVCNNQLVAEDIKKVTPNSNIKFLFFGNLSTVKGIDTVLNSFDQLSLKKLNIELIIAGKNVENIDFSKYKNKPNYHIYDRHINDDELIYLYKVSNYILLPYKKSSQSGIFAMSAYFRKPMILSDIPYFKNMLKEFPSFGILSALNEYSISILNIIQNTKFQFYTLEDCKRFEEKDKIENFLNLFLSEKN